MRFSQRNGHKPIRTLLQTESIDTDLRNGLWNALQTIWDSHSSRSSTYQSRSEYSNLQPLIRALWKDYFKQPLDQVPQYIQGVVKELRAYFFSCEWYEVYDFVEFACQHVSRSLGEKGRLRFVELCNQALEREIAGYRLIDSQIVPITSESELSSIEESLNNSTRIPGAHEHIRRAIELLSDRQNPDYRNSIKESISAVEAVAQTITGDPKATLGAALGEVSKKAAMHPALNKSLSALYGYTSDSQGIRHALLEESNLDFVDAKFMLVACSAFVNYLIGKTAT